MTYMKNMIRNFKKTIFLGTLELTSSFSLVMVNGKRIMLTYSLKRITMKAIKLVLLIVLLALAGMIAGCQEGYARQSNYEKIYYGQRADGLRIPSYSHTK